MGAVQLLAGGRGRRPQDAGKWKETESPLELLERAELCQQSGVSPSFCTSDFLNYRHTSFYCISQILHFFPNWKQDPPPARRLGLALLRYSLYYGGLGTKAVISLRYACLRIYICIVLSYEICSDLSQQEEGITKTKRISPLSLLHCYCSSLMST